ncbi:aquaporin Z [Brachybacterium sp. DNPG3]
MSADPSPSLLSKLAAEALGTFWLVLGGCGSAIFAAGFLNADGTHLGIGFLGVALAFGLTVVTGAYAVGHISGGHFNPAVSFGCFLANRLEAKLLLPYWGAQVVGGLVAAVVLYVVASGADGFSIDPTAAGSFATNGYGELSPGGYSLLSAAIIEIVLTAIFLWVILGVTDGRAPAGFAPLAIGLTLTLIHLVAIPITNTSVNPARSIAVAVFDTGALKQVWLFILAPLVGAAIAGLGHKALFAAKS